MCPVLMFLLVTKIQSMDRKQVEESRNKNKAMSKVVPKPNTRSTARVRRQSTKVANRCSSPSPAPSAAKDKVSIYVN